MSDSALAYRRIEHKGLVDKHLVNHNSIPKELTRSVSALANVKTRAPRPAMASTNLIDSEWKRHLKTRFPSA